MDSPREESFLVMGRSDVLFNEIALEFFDIQRVQALADLLLPSVGQARGFIMRLRAGEMTDPVRLAHAVLQEWVACSPAEATKSRLLHALWEVNPAVAHNFESRLREEPRPVEIGAQSVAGENVAEALTPPAIRYTHQPSPNARTTLMSHTHTTFPHKSSYNFLFLVSPSFIIKKKLAHGGQASRHESHTVVVCVRLTLSLD